MSKDIGCAFTLCPIQALRKFASVICWARSLLSQATEQLDSTRPRFLQQTRAGLKRSIFDTWKRARYTSLMHKCQEGHILGAELAYYQKLQPGTIARFFVRVLGRVAYSLPANRKIGPVVLEKLQPPIREATKALRRPEPQAFRSMWSRCSVGAPRFGCSALRQFLALVNLQQKTSACPDSVESPA